jgi:hypothetical protein
MFVQDFILNGSAQGEVGETLQGCRFDPGLLRPYLDEHGHRCVTVNTGRTRYDPKLKKVVPIHEKARIGDLQNRGIMSPVFNATSLRKEEWIELDRVVIRAARFRLRAWADLSAANQFGGFNAMSKLILEHETMSDPGEAIVDMDGLTEGRTDSPKFQLEGLPLPITHSDFWFSSRRLAVSRNTGTPLDTTMAEGAGRRVAELIEKTVLGVETGITYGGNSTQVGGYGRTPSVYGYTNFPQRLTVTGLYRPTGLGRSGTGWVAADTLKDILRMRDLLYANKFYGPFMIYHSNDWDQYMDNDYILSGGNVATQTLRERLKAIDNITDVRRLDFLSSTATAAGDPARITTTFPFTFLLVQMTADVCRAVNGMDITTVQWESVGGMRLNFKVMCIQVPQLRADFNGNTGIAQGTATI